MRTPEEILRQIEGLKKLKDTLPKYNIFGDDNWEPIDAQINILEGTKSYGYYENEEYEIESAAYIADAWLKGDTDEELFEE